MLTTIDPTARHAHRVEASPRQATANPSDPAGFASQLRQMQATPASPTPAPPATKVAAEAHAPLNGTHGEAHDAPPPTAAAETAPADAESESEATDLAPATPRQRTALKPRPRETDGHAGVREAAGPSGDRALPADEGEADEAEAEAEVVNAKAAAAASASSGNPAHANPPLDPCVMHWFAGQQRAGDAAEAADAAGEATPTAPTDTPNRPSRRLGEAPDLDPRGKPVHARGVAEDNTASARAFDSALAQSVTKEAQTQTQLAGHAATPAPSTATQAAFAATAGPINTVDTAANATIAAPTASPAFAQELGLTLGVFAREGVQHAELHLNPAEMGPVSVQIAIEGNQARIDFGADLAATRHAIEQGLPALASALADAGFTLAGGGVSQHAGQSRSGFSGGERRAREPAGPDTRFRNISADGLASAASAARRIVTAGGVDVFA